MSPVREGCAAAVEILVVAIEMDMAGTPRRRRQMRFLMAMLMQATVSFFIYSLGIVRSAGVTVILSWRQPPKALVAMTRISKAAYLLATTAYEEEAKYVESEVQARGRIRAPSGNPLSR